MLRVNRTVTSVALIALLLAGHFPIWEISDAAANRPALRLHAICCGASSCCMGKAACTSGGQCVASQPEGPNVDQLPCLRSGPCGPSQAQVTPTRTDVGLTPAAAPLLGPVWDRIQFTASTRIRPTIAIDPADPPPRA
jgi:hypothetical protein